MAIPVYFDSQLKNGTIKVDHIRVDAVLSEKALAEQLLPPKFCPDHRLRFGDRLTKFATLVLV